MANENEINSTPNPYWEPVQSFDPSWQLGDGVLRPEYQSANQSVAAKPTRTEYVTITPAERARVEQERVKAKVALAMKEVDRPQPFAVRVWNEVQFFGSVMSTSTREAPENFLIGAGAILYGAASVLSAASNIACTPGKIGVGGPAANQTNPPPVETPDASTQADSSQTPDAGVPRDQSKPADDMAQSAGDMAQPVGDMAQPENPDMLMTPNPDMAEKPNPDMSEQPDLVNPRDMMTPPDLVPLPQKPIELNANATSTLNNFGTTGHKTAYGDVDGDGRLDLVVGDTDADQTQINEGALRIVSDFNNKLPNNQQADVKNISDAMVWGGGGNYGLGASVYLADVNGDGKADVFAGSTGYKGVGAVFRINGRSMADLRMLPTMKQISLALDNNQNAQGVSILVGSANDVGGLGYEIKPAPGSNVLFVGAGNFIRIVPDANFQGKITVDQMGAVDVIDSIGQSTWAYAPLDSNNFATANSEAFNGTGEVQTTSAMNPPLLLDLSKEPPPNGVTVRRLRGSQASEAGYSMSARGGLVFVGVPAYNSPDNNGAVTILSSMPQQDGMLAQVSRTRVIGPKQSGFGKHNTTFEKNGKVVECALAPDNNDAALYIFEDAGKLPAGDVNAEDVATKIYRNVNIKGAHNLTCVDGYASYETLQGDVVVVRTQ